MGQWFSMFVNSNSNKSCFSNMAPQTQVPKGCNCFHSNTLKLFFFFSLLCEYLLRNRIRQTPTNPEGVGGIDRPGGSMAATASALLWTAHCHPDLLSWWPVLVNVPQGCPWWSGAVFIMPQSQGTHGKWRGGGERTHRSHQLTWKFSGQPREKQVCLSRWNQIVRLP